MKAMKKAVPRKTKMSTNVAALYQRHAFKFRPLIDEIKKHVKKGATVIDLGCGTGIHVSIIKKQIGKEGRLICVDKNKAMIAYCKKRFSKDNVIFKRLPAEKLSTLGEKADVIFASLVLQFTKADKALTEIRKSLKPKGTLIFDIPLYRTGITIGIDKESKKFREEFINNLKKELEMRGIRNNPTFEYPNVRNLLFKELLRKNRFKISSWSILPLEKNDLKLLLNYYKIPWRSEKILKAPFKVRYGALSNALRRTFKKYPKFLVKRYYLIAVVKKNAS